MKSSMHRQTSFSPSGWHAGVTPGFTIGKRIWGCSSVFILPDGFFDGAIVITDDASSESVSDQDGLQGRTVLECQVGKELLTGIEALI